MTPAVLPFAISIIRKARFGLGRLVLAGTISAAALGHGCLNAALVADDTVSGKDAIEILYTYILIGRPASYFGGGQVAAGANINKKGRYLRTDVEACGTIVALTLAAAQCTPVSTGTTSSLSTTCQEGPVFFRSAALGFEACGLTEYKPGEYATALPD